MQLGNDVAALVEVAAHAASVVTYERAVLEILRHRLGFDVAMFKRPDGLGAHGLDPAIERACLPHWPQFKLDTLPVAQIAHAHGGVAVDVDVLGWSRMERLSYYQLLMRPHRGTSTAIICLMRRGAPAASLCLGRTHGGFADRELAYLRALAPTLSVCEAAALVPPLTAAGVEDVTTTALTRREREVLSHLGLGHTNAQIALALGTAERTVRNQLSSIYEKLGVGSRAEAAALWCELRLGHPRNTPSTPSTRA